MRRHARLLAHGALALAALAAACTANTGPSTLDRGSPEGTGATTATPSGAQGGTSSGAPGGDHGAGQGTTATGLPCDVGALLAKNCATCHGAVPAFGAPSPLVTYDDLTKAGAGGAIYLDVQKRVHASQGVMPPPPSSPLSATDLQAFDAWVAGGAQRSDASCSAPPDAGPPVKPLSCTPDQFIRSPSAFTMPPDKADIYMCYGFDVPTTAKRHVVGFAPKIDNPKIVHHLLLFQADASYGTTPQECSATTSAQWRLVTGWAPGGPNLETPPEAGFPEEGTTHWILQVHYNNASGQNAGQVDESGYDLCTTDQLRPNDADVMATGTLKATLPPRATTDLTCTWSPLFIGKVHLFGTTPHMHELGTKMSTYVSHAGQSTKIVDEPTFDFNYQTAYPTSVDVENGDTVSTRCVWNNTSDQTVTWGENTGDEMCFNFISYYPKIPSGLWSWALPSAVASCAPTK